MSIVQGTPEPSKAVKLSLTLPAEVHSALATQAESRFRDTNAHIQRLLTNYVIQQELLSEETAYRLQLFWSLVERAVEQAKALCRNGYFDRTIIHKSIETCTKDPKWAADYYNYVKDDIFKHGNPLKGVINREIGWQIRAGIGGATVKRPDGKPQLAKVLGSIIQSYTPMATFDQSAVAV